MSVCLSAGPPYGNIHWGLPALHAEHSGGDSLSAPHLDCRHSRHSRIFRHCLHVLHLRKYLTASDDELLNESQNVAVLNKLSLLASHQ